MEVFFKEAFSRNHFRSRPNLATLGGIPGIAASRNSAQLPGVQAQWEKKFNTTEKKNACSDVSLVEKKVFIVFMARF